MIEVDISRAQSFLSAPEFAKSHKKAEQAFKQVQQKNGKGSEWLGWRSMLADPGDTVLEQCERLSTTIREEADIFIMCGIGGSYMGARAVIEALSSFFGNGGPEILYAGHHMSGKYLTELIRYLETPNSEGEPRSVYLNVISKSGTTLETALSFRILRNWMQERFEDITDRIICTTSAEGGALNQLIDEHHYRKFVIPDDVGGRFSVLTPVGLLPIAVAGIDIHSLFYEAVAKYAALEEDPEPVLKYAAARHALYKQGKAIDIFTTFEPQLNAFCGWLQQLLGESEGKEKKGIYPAKAAFSTDLHSVGQFIQQGSRNMIETFLCVQSENKNLDVAAQEQNHDGLNYLAGRSFHDINSRALEGTIAAHHKGGVPCIITTLEQLDAPHLGEFIYIYELMTAIYCYCLEVNPFNQPGVELYKKEMYKLLGK